MNIEYSKEFIKAAYKLTGKYKSSLQKIVLELKQAEDLTEITSCIKLVGLQRSYRIKMGNYRIIFIVTPQNIVFFELLVSRGEVYKKEYENILKKKEKTKIKNDTDKTD